MPRRLRKGLGVTDGIGRVGIVLEPPGVILYKYLTSQPEYASREQRQFLIRRLREVLVKLVVAIGFPKSLESMVSLAKAIEELDNDDSFTRANWISEQLKVPE
ncbi:hypothetical protein BJY01DRAFT_245008 [Aspergillus pseudoustus]|uniref:Uncharacterized protein n=1 Tax=Aspergillus pseudoustus TaxID=1810923 RepID=A0ABR4KGT5_9EURO